MRDDTAARSDAGRREPCRFCCEPTGHFEERCSRYTVLLDAPDPGSLPLDPKPGPEAA